MQDSDSSVKLRPTISSISSHPDLESTPISSLALSQQRSSLDKSLQTEMPGWPAALDGELHLRLQRPGALLCPQEDQVYVEMVQPLFQLGDLDSFQRVSDDSLISELLDRAESQLQATEQTPRRPQPFILTNKLFGGKLLKRLVVSDK